MADKLWLVGRCTSNDDKGRWMVEGLFVSEEEAANHAKEDEFIVLVTVGDRLPVNVIDAEKLYWPKRETWETSNLYKLKQFQE